MTDDEKIKLLTTIVQQVAGCCRCGSCSELALETLEFLKFGETKSNDVLSNGES